MSNFSSFNAFGSETIDNANRLPVWLGVVSPVPVGGTLVKDYAQKGLLLNAGFPVKLASKIITPLIAWEVVSSTTVDTNDNIVIKPCILGDVTIVPAVGDIIQKIGTTFATTGKAAAVTAVSALTGNDAGKYQVTVLHSATIDSVSAGDAITYSASESAGSAKSIAVIPNGYLYNDIYFGNLDGTANSYDIAATGAVVEHHPEGLLVELTPAALVKTQMAAAVPYVRQQLV